MAGSSSTLQTITKLTWHRHVFHTCTQHFKTIRAIKKFFTNWRERSMLPTLWVLEAFLFPMNKIHTNFQTYWPDGVKMPPFESQNFEACSLRPPMLWSGLSCRDPFFESFDSGPHEVKVAQKPATHNQYIFTRNTVFKVPRFGKKNTDIVTLPKIGRASCRERV